MDDNLSKESCDTQVTTDLEGDFSSLNLSDISPEKKSIKKPKRILHFSDGTLEEFSSDEENEPPPPPPSVAELVDPTSLTWKPWMTYYASKTGKSVLSTCDYIGEGIANFLGITSQKYFYEIEEYKRSVQQEQDEKKEEAAQMAGWTTGATELGDIKDTPERKDDFLRKNFEIIDGMKIIPDKKEKEKF